MKTVKVIIEETCVQEFDIDVADDDENVVDIAIEKYNNGELVLEPGEVQHKQIAAVTPKEDKPEWIEF